MTLIIGLAITAADAEVPVAINWGTFQAEGRQTRLEVYLGFDRSSLEYRIEGENPVARLATVVMIKRRGAIIAFRELEAADYRPQAPGYIAQQVNFTLSPDNYDLQIVAEDQAGTLVDTTLALEVPQLRRRGIRIGSLEPAYLIRPDAAKGDMTKHGLLVVPNAAAVYDRDHPLLWYYTEFYGIAPHDSIVLETKVTQAGGQIYLSDQQRLKAVNLTFKEWGAVNVAGYVPGDYRLSFKATVDDQTVVTGTDFQVAEYDTTDAGNDSGIDLAVGVAAVRPQFNLARYEAADSTAQAQWLQRAVQQLAITVERDSTGYLAELISNWPLAKRYDPGWNTTGRLSEMGRVMLLYGLPFAIQVYPAGNSANEYQVWDYSGLDSGRVVVFSYSSVRAEYLLAHGTLPGTPFSAGWQGRLPARFAVEAPPEQATADSAATDSTVVEPGQTQPEPERPEPTLLAQPADTAQGKIDIEPESVVPDSAAQDTIAAPLAQPIDTAQGKIDIQPESAVPDSAVQDTIAAPLTQPADTAQGKIDIQPESAVPDSAVQDTIAAPQEPQAPPEDNTAMAIPSETEISGPDSVLQDTGTVAPAPADTLSPQ